jgi:acetyl-CoA C-acetyltransferase
VTAGNASTLSDGAAALVVASDELARSRGLKPLAVIAGQATASADPRDLFIAPAFAIRKLVGQVGWSLSSVDLFEINEAFAAQMVACMKALEIPADRVNVNGGAIALGHPIGASGARVLATLLYAMKNRGAKRGIASLCLGGGEAVALAVETL